jgi:hypothetical protein
MSALARVARRIVRKALKPLRLRLIAWRAARAEEYAADLADMREVYAKAIATQQEYLVYLADQRMQIERGLA